MGVKMAKHNRTQQTQQRCENAQMYEYKCFSDFYTSIKNANVVFLKCCVLNPPKIHICVREKKIAKY